MTAMKKNKSIKTLKIDSKNILRFLIFISLSIVGAADDECNVEGAKAIAAMLAENDTLIELSISCENHSSVSRGVKLIVLCSKAINLATLVPLQSPTHCRPTRR